MVALLIRSLRAGILIRSDARGISFVDDNSLLRVGGTYAPEDGLFRLEELKGRWLIVVCDRSDKRLYRPFDVTDHGIYRIGLRAEKMLTPDEVLVQQVQGILRSLGVEDAKVNLQVPGKSRPLSEWHSCLCGARPNQMSSLWTTDGNVLVRKTEKQLTRCCGQPRWVRYIRVSKATYALKIVERRQGKQVVSSITSVLLWPNPDRGNLIDFKKLRQVIEEFR